MENLEDMKTMWLELNNRLSFLEEENRKMARQVMNEKYKTARDRLINKYRGFIIIEFILMIYISWFFYFNPLVVEKYRLLAIIYWGVFFLGEVAIDFYLMVKIKGIDIYNSSVSTIAKTAAKNWKIHKIAMCIGLPLAIGAIIIFGLALDANEFTIFGMIVGGLVGLIIGIRQLIKFLNYYKLLQSNN